MKYTINQNNNFCRIFRMPDVFPSGFCFGGGLPVTFTMVDWFEPVPLQSREAEMREEDIKYMLIAFLQPKQYVQPGYTFLVLCDFGLTFTFKGE